MLKPWREVAVPHEDVLKGTFQQAEFAADLSRVHDGTATVEYQEPKLFYERTFITEGMRLLLDSVVHRLAGKGGDPVIQLQTAFGGGKTHTLLAVYHLAKGSVAPSSLLGLQPILAGAGVKELPPARIVVLDGIRLSPSQPSRRDGVKVCTLWGELAWQLGGKNAYIKVKEADESGTSPGKAVLAALLKEYSPCVILMDEMVAYLRQFEQGRTYAGGTFDSNLTFFQALTEALKAAPQAVLLASLPESHMEVGSVRGQAALDALEKSFGRVHALWKPVGSEEAFEIVRRRLFTAVSDKLAVESVCRAFADFYVEQSADFPKETQDSRYYDRLLRAYPIHPEVFERLYQDWSTLDKFQRTRGVLKLMAKVIHRLWKDNNKDLMITPGSLPLYDPDVRNEAIYYLPQGWDPVIERDVDGEHAETTDIENREPLLGSVQAARRVARTVFLGSAPTTQSQMVRGIELERVVLGCAQPGQQPSRYKDALRRLTERLHYLNVGNNRYWLDVRPNLRREMEERKRRFADKDDVLPILQERVRKLFAQSVFAGIHIFTPSADVPDDWGLRLVVLPPDAGYSKGNTGTARERALEIIRTRGEQPRQRQNRLIFLAPDYDHVARMKDQTRVMLAWQSIVDDVHENKLVLDNLQINNAQKSAEDAQNILNRLLRDTYRWILAPMQEVMGEKPSQEIQWEAFPVSPTALNLTQEIERVLRENELLITEWAPIHLRKILTEWYWRDGKESVQALAVWQDTCRYLYLPRLRDDGVFHNTLSVGAASKDFFGISYGKEGEKWEGFTLGQAYNVIIDDALLLIEPKVATAYAAKLATEKTAENADSGVTAMPSPGEVTTEPASPQQAGSAVTKSPKKRFYGTLELDPVKAKLSFAQVVEEVVQQFTMKHNVSVRISVEIRADSPTAFDDNTQRTVRENCAVLKFKTSEFEEG
ncbi:MAG TPA: DUF499 domain-containing protein [Ktedonobacteraceae bacterium]|nr:DUF499 domain-containing protein [Ktedonobacteraceae bacterium]